MQEINRLLETPCYIIDVLSQRSLMASRKNVLVM